MVKIMDLGILGIDSSSIHPVALILICSIFVVSGIAVFVFGFKKPEQPERRKTAENNSNNQAKRKKPTKQSTAVVTAAIGATSKSPIPQQQLNKSQVTKTATVVGSKESKKKINSAGPKKAPTPTGQKKNKTATPLAKSTKQAAKPIKANNSNDGGDGEWQTVLSKKQKKHGDPLLQAVAQVAAKATKNSKGAGLEIEQKRKKKLSAE